MPYLLTCAWLLGIVYASVPLFWFAVHPFAQRWRARRGSVYKLLGLFWVIEWMLLGVATAPFRHLRLYSTPWAWLAAALLLLLAMSVYLRVGAGFGNARLIGRHELRAGGPQLLVVTGLHARVRHPIYLAHLCSLTAWTLGSGLAVLYGLWLFAVLTGALMVRMEERELVSRFGEEYRAYQRRVPMLLPRP